MIEDRFVICSASCLHFNASLLHRLLCKTLYTKVAEKCRPIIFHPRTNKITKANQKTGEIIQTFYLVRVVSPDEHFISSYLIVINRTNCIK